MNFQNDNPDILTECVMNTAKILALIMFAEIHRGYCSASPLIMLDFLDRRAHSLSTATNTSTLMGGCLTLCASYSAVQWVRTNDGVLRRTITALWLESPRMDIFEYFKSTNLNKLKTMR